MGMSTNDPAGLWFVHRSHRDGPLSRRVRRLTLAAAPGHEDPDPILLLWFQKLLAQARTVAEPDRIADAALGGRVAGLTTVFDTVKAKRLPIPKTIAALERFLRAHLHVEGGADHLRVTDHTLRVLTTDDDGPIAYYFLDDEAVAAHADRVGFLMLDDPRLPDGAGADAFRPPVKPTPLLPAGTGAGTTFACLLTHHHGPAVPGRVVAWAGVRLPDLAAHLRTVIPHATPAAVADAGLETWPVELRLLRAQVDPADRLLSSALERCAAYPLDGLADADAVNRLGLGDHASARAEFKAAAAQLAGPGPEPAIVHEGDHVAVLCAHTSQDHGYQQWILFDDRWAAAQPNLAASIVRYASDWDPFIWRKPKKKSAKESAADTLLRSWERGIGKRTEADAEPYKLSARYVVGSLLQHASFGLGAVELIDGSKIQVVFQDARRMLVHGRVA